jgi:signal transduction histidine kinase/CheY-like chemotaxis protein
LIAALNYNISCATLLDKEAQSVPKRIFAIISSLIIIAAVIFSFAYFGKQDTANDNSLYIDLTAGPAYAKEGFVPADAKILNPDNLVWDTILPAFHGAIIPTEWNGDGSKGERRFLSPHNQGAREYTILIPFEIRPEAITKMYEVPIQDPALFLAGIGDNWEIYLNGRIVKSNIHLDDKNRLTTHRAWRAVVVPLDRDYFKPGTNSLVFRIIGAPSDKKTGLFYSSPYYIGEYSSAIVQRVSLITMVFCAIYVFVGIYHLLLFFMRRNNKYNLAYGFFSITIALYFLSRTAAIYLISENSAVTQRMEYAVLYLLPFLLGAFIEDLNFKKLLRPTKIYALLCISFMILQSVFSVQFAIDLLNVWQVIAILFMLYLFIYDVIIAFFTRVNSQWKQLISEGINANRLNLTGKNLTGTSLGNIFIIIIFLFATAAFDILDSAVLHTGIMLTSYSFFIFTVGVALILAREFASSYNRADKMNEILETLVKERTKELEEQVDIAEKASQAKGDFLANMSHEMRTPINAVVGMTLIGKTAADIPKKDYCFDRIDEASTHLLGVINDILDMSKIEADKLELSEAVYDFRSLIDRVVHVITFKTEEKQQKLTVDIDEKIPPSLIGDDQRLAQVIANLLSNAVKFTPNSGIIELTAAMAEDTDEDCVLRIEVKDSGIGISEEQQARLFVPFQQADNGTSRTYGGTGLGLAISKRIVELMDGEIWVKSQPGQGSVFGFTIREKHVRNCKMPDEMVPDNEIIQGEFKGRTALLVDDIEINREIVISILEETGLSIEVAGNGAEAIEQFINNQGRFDIILMDVQMPVMDGYIATERIRALDITNAKKIPIIAMTANVFKEDIENSKKAGMNEHIGKPINLPELLLILRKYLLPHI